MLDCGPKVYGDSRNLYCHGCRRTTTHARRGNTFACPCGREKTISKTKEAPK